MKKKNPTAKERELAADWQALLDKHSKPLEKGAKAYGTKVKLQKPKAVNHHVQESRQVDFKTKYGGVAAKKDSKVYTGEKMLGIGTLHKSNAVPVFSDEEAKDISKMRRG